MRFRIVAAAAALALCAPAWAQQGEQWEVTSQMNVPGMPAGMGAQTQRVCLGKDPKENATKGRNEKCKVTDMKQTGTRTTITMTCPEGTAVIDQTYNAARTEYKGTMKFTGRDGEMVMNSSGRKIGACDYAAESRKRDQQVADAKQQAAAASAAGAAAVKDANDRAMKQCASAVETMETHPLGMYWQCYGKSSDASCKSFMDSMSRSQPEVTKSCNARVPEFCKRFQTQAGFVKARGRQEIAAKCGVSIAAIKAEQCPRAAKGESGLAFLGRFCPVEAKPVAEANCKGRAYTSQETGKYADFCIAYYSNQDFEDKGEQASGTTRQQRGAAGQAPAPSAPQQPDQQQQVKDAAQKGLNAIKGLFGR